MGGRRNTDRTPVIQKLHGFMLCMVLLCIVSFLPAANFVDENAIRIASIR